jgi:hypothetical protein
MQKPRKIQTVHVEKLDNELCVYDWQRKEVHNLNPTAALVWELCDGQTDPAQIADQLRADLGTSYVEDVVWMTLTELEQAHLLESEVVQPAGRSLMSRRTLLKQMGVAAALLPVVATIVAPGPVQAQTPGGECTPNQNATTIGTWRPVNQGCGAGDQSFDGLRLTTAQVVSDLQELCPCDGGYETLFGGDGGCAECAAEAARQGADFYRWGTVVTGEPIFECTLIFCNDSDNINNT